MDLPDNNTLKILEERKNHLNKRIKNDNNPNSYILAEIGALDRTINFINLIKNNISDETIKTIIARQADEDKKELLKEYKDEDNYETLYSYEKEITENYKLDISFIKYKKERQILLALKKYKKNFFKWVYQGRVRLSQTILEDILKKSNEI